MTRLTSAHVCVPQSDNQASSERDVELFRLDSAGGFDITIDSEWAQDGWFWTVVSRPDGKGDIAEEEHNLSDADARLFLVVGNKKVSL